MAPQCPNGGGFVSSLDKCQASPYPDTDNNDCTSNVGKPVSVANGKVVVTETEFSVSGGIMPLNFTRFYNSKTAQTLIRSFGRTWGHNFDTRIISYWGTSIYKVINPDGSTYYYNDTDGDKVYDVDIPKGESSRLIKNPDNTFRREFKDGTKEEFNTSGYITAIIDRNGNRISLTRDTYNKLTVVTDPSGRMISIAYNTSNYISYVVLPDGKTITYTYVSGALQKVTYPDGTYKTYEYSGYNLTGIKNEKGNYIEKHTYDAQGRGTTSSADGTNDKLTINYISDTQTTVTDSLGRVTTYTFDKSKGKARVMSISGPGCRECGQGDVSFSYDDKLNIISSADANGNITTYTYDADGNMLTKTEAYGKSLQRTTTYTYNQFGQALTITDPSGNITTNAYDAKGNLLSTIDALGNVTSYTYDARGLRTSMTDPNGNTTTYTYDQYGNLATIADPLNNVTSYTNDIMGRILSMTDANNNTTTYEYDLMGRLKKITAPDGGITSYEYDLAGNITAVVDAMGNRTTNTYDTINRLTKVTDPENNAINYTYDSQSNKTSMTIKDSLNATMTSDTYTYDDHNRLSRTTHPEGGTYTEQTYDSNGNVITKRDENGNIYTYAYDALNRLVSVTDPMAGITSYAYDARNNLSTVTDANGNTTTYTYDNLNRLASTASPDTGTTTYTYDFNGNLLTKTDANSITITYTYDSVNRITSMQFPDTSQNITYTYDNCPNGKGKLCGMTDLSGTTSYEYNTKGKVVKETKIINNVTYITEYGYDLNGNLTSMTYPGGRVIGYNYTNNKARSILNNSVTIASNITYKPFGRMTSLTYGNGLIQTTGYDNRYRVSSIANDGIQNLTYTYDNNGNITGITNNLDPAKNKTYVYDTLNRLANATGPWGMISYSYDGVGNRQTESTGTGVTNYAYTANKLNTTTGEKAFSFTYDPNGNTITGNTRQYIYNQNQRLIRAMEGQTVLGEYVYNGNGQRVKKTTASGIVIFHYDLKGQIMAESSNAGTITSEYVFLNSTPFAKIEGNNVYYYHNDHLGAPQKMTDSSAVVVWYGEFLPFGEPFSITGTITNNLRFPGQYYDEETGLHYNYFRDYKPMIGRYVEADPVGIKKGKNHLYSYVRNRPTILSDPTGLIETNCPCIDVICIIRAFPNLYWCWARVSCKLCRFEVRGLEFLGDYYLYPGGFVAIPFSCEEFPPPSGREA